MRKISRGMVALVAVFGMITVGSADLITIKVTDDAEIRSADPDGNYGTIDAAIAELTTTPTYRKIYVQFDASGLGDGVMVTNISSFTMHNTYTYARTAQFYLITGDGADSWDETTITWNNAPGNNTGSYTFLNDASFSSTYLGVSSNATGVIGFDWDSSAAIDSVINELNTGDRIATIAITRNSTSRLVRFAAHEAEENGYTTMQMDLETVPEPTSVTLTLIGFTSTILLRHLRR